MHDGTTTEQKPTIRSITADKDTLYTLYTNTFSTLLNKYILGSAFSFPQNFDELYNMKVQQELLTSVSIAKKGSNSTKM